MAQTKSPITSQQLINLGRRALSLLFAVYLVFLLGRVVYQNYLVKSHVTQIEDQIKELKTNNQRLTNLVTYYQTETFRELEARSKLGLKKPGETVIALPENSDETPIDPTKQVEENKQTKPNEVPNWQKWWEYLFGQE